MGSWPSGGEQIDDLLDRLVGVVVGGFELADWLVAASGRWWKRWAAEAFVEKEKELRDLNALRGETVGVAGCVTLHQPAALELAQVVAELVQAVGAVGEVEG